MREGESLFPTTRGCLSFCGHIRHVKSMRLFPLDNSLFFESEVVSNLHHYTVIPWESLYSQQIICSKQINIYWGSISHSGINRSRVSRTVVLWAKQLLKPMEPMSRFVHVCVCNTYLGQQVSALHCPAAMGWLFLWETVSSSRNSDNSLSLLFTK